VQGRHLALVSALLASSVVFAAAPTQAALTGQCIAVSAFRPYTDDGYEITKVATPDGTSWAIPQEVLDWAPDRRRTVHLGENADGFSSTALRIGQPNSKKSSIVFDYFKRDLRSTNATRPQFSPDGRRVAFIATATIDFISTGELWVVNLATKKATRVSTKGQAVVNTFAWSPDGRKLYYAAARAKSGLFWDDRQADVFVASSSGVGTPTRIITTAFYAAGSYPISIRFDPPARIMDLSVSPDGRTLVFTGYDFQGRNGAVPDLWLADSTGANVRQIANNDQGQTGHHYPQWSPNGQRLAVALAGNPDDDGLTGLGVYDVATSGWVRISRAGQGVGVPSWSPDGSTVAFVADRSSSFGSYENDTYVVDVASGKRSRVLAGTGTSVRYDLTVWLPCLRAAPVCGGRPATILGTNRTDRIQGTNGNDVIVAFGGNDTIDGRGGNDRICGGSGNDVLRGGPGNDLLYGESGSDRLDGGPGADVLDGGPQTDVCTGRGDRLRRCP
jgi:Tol biopolymer transport system component